MLRGLDRHDFLPDLHNYQVPTSKVARPSCPNCGWPFFTDAVRMEDSETSLAMCTRCHALLEAPAGEERQSVADRILTLFASAVDWIITLVVRALYGRGQRRAG
jgi:hypothetical protein